MSRKKRINEMKKVLISIKGLPVFADGNNDGFELTTDGEYLQTEGGSMFSYLESTLTGQSEGGVMTIFNVEPDRIILKRDDNMTGDMIFSEKQKQHFLHETPFGSVMMGIDTHSIVKNMNDKGGNIEIRYNIEIDNVAVSRNLFKIDIKSFPQ